VNTDQKIIKNKVGLLNLADMLGSVSEACKVMGYSRDSLPSRWACSKLLSPESGVPLHSNPTAARRLNYQPTRSLWKKMRDIVGLYLNPPNRAIVLCVDEKSQVQALDRTRPVLPLRPGVPERQTQDYMLLWTSLPAR